MCGFDICVYCKMVVAMEPLSRHIIAFFLVWWKHSRSTLLAALKYKTQYYQHSIINYNPHGVH